MQIKPSTAAGDRVNIQGVDKDLEKKINAGVKYLVFIIFYSGELLQGCADESHKPRTVRVRFLQCRSKSHRKVEKAGRGLRLRPERLVQ